VGESLEATAIPVVVRRARRRGTTGMRAVFRLLPLELLSN